MRLLEYEGKNVFENFDIPVPEGKVIESTEELEEVTDMMEFPIILKSQIPSGGRGKAGGIKKVNTKEEALETADELLNSQLKGYEVKSLLIEEVIDIEQEMYCGVVGDDEKGRPEIIVSTKGGVNIEKIAEEDPESIERFNVDPYEGLKPYQARNLASNLNLEKNVFRSFSDTLYKLYNVFDSHDAKLAEINPLVITGTGDMIAADSKLVVDDHSLYRHPELEDKKSRHIENVLEKEGEEKGVNYVDLDGNIAIMANGAGLAMALMDLISEKGDSPAAFLDTGGGLSEQRMKDALNLLVKKAKKEKKVKSILVNIRFMISPPDAMVNGFKKAVREKEDIEVPIVLVVRGRKKYVNKAKELLKDSEIEMYTDVEKGVKAASEKPERR